MLIVKIMSGEDAPDHDTRKSFTLHAGVSSAVFERIGNGTSDDARTFTRPWLTLFFAGEADSESFEPHGNVYVMNERGQTVASYGVAPLDPGPDIQDPGRPSQTAAIQLSREDSDKIGAEISRAVRVVSNPQFRDDFDVVFDSDKLFHILQGTLAVFGGAAVADADAQVKRMADRFLSWRLPATFQPDGGVSFSRTISAGTPHEHERTPDGPDWPRGTNVFDYDQARQMVRHLLGLTDGPA